MTRTIRSDSMLPPSASDYSRIQSLIDWYHWLWQQAPLALGSGNLDLLRVYAALIIDNAVPHATAIDCIASMLSNEPRKFSYVEIPAQRNDQSSRLTCISLALSTRLAAYCWKARLAYEKSTGSETTAKTLIEIIRCEIKDQFSASLSCAPQQGELTIMDLQRLGLILAIRGGVDPYLISALQSTVRPISQSRDDPYLLTDVSREALSHLFLRHDGLSLRAGKLGRAAVPVDDLLESVPSDWVAQAKKLLRRMCCELGESISGRVNTPKKRAAALGILESYEKLATEMGPDDSVVLLAIKYSRHRYVDNPTIVASSLRHYLDRAVISGLLDTEASYSLGDWEPDDFWENVEDRLSSPRLSRRSRGLILEAYKPLLRFLASELEIPRISVSALAEEFVGGSGQWRLISAPAIDNVIAELSFNSRPHFREAAIVIALAYYGGLRATEIRRLTLSDIVFSDFLPNVDVELQRGKTANARRRIPLAALAPPHITRLIVDHWHDRITEFPDSTALSRIAFLGPRCSTDGYQYHSLSSLARGLLKRAFGASANIHLLRHSFCSNLFLRWYALRRPDILRDFRDRGHAIFQPELQRKLTSYFDCIPHQDGDIRPYDLVSMIKLTGHASPSTLFQYYVHSFSVVQEHAVSIMSSPIGDLRLAGNVIAKLVPRLSSSASRAKLSSPTVHGIACHIFGDGGCLFRNAVESTGALAL